MLMKGLSEQQKQILIALGKFLLIWAIALIIIVMLVGCKSVQSQTQVNYKDTTIVHKIIDTTRIYITDTIHVEASSGSESESQTVIQFGEGGGTYNAITGQATNVANVQQASKDKEYQQTIRDQKTTIDQRDATIDSLYRANSELHEQIELQQNTKDITPRSGWDNFTTWWFIGSVIVLLLLLAYAVWRIYRKFFLHI